jgi:predicted dehydrogenase
MITRRSFLKNAALSAAAVSLPARIYSAAEGSNSDIRIAVIGFNGRGQSHIGGYLGLKGVRIVALCDVDKNVLQKGVDQLKKKGQEVTPYQDIRKLLENKEIDAVSVATPNHWHSLAGIWSIQAGKDLYVEKPISHNVWEGRQLVKAAANSTRIVQMGVQSRSAYGIRKGIEWANEGHLGKLVYVRGLCYKRRPSIGKVDSAQPIPEGIDYDLWCGPAPKSPLMRKKLHYDWHWVWETGNGDLGNQGIHQMDIARRFTGENTLAPKVLSIGGRLGYIDDGQTPNSQIIFQDYEKAPLIFEVRGLPESANAKDMDKYRGASIGVVAQYERGHIVVPNYNDAIAYDSDGKEIQKFTLPKDKSAGPTTPEDPRENHFANFIGAVISRKGESLNGKILDGHLSSALCHTGNISHRLGQQKAAEDIRSAIKGDKEATDSFERLATHLAANQIDINMDKLTLGEFLKMDVQTEKFIGNPAADKMLTREYRAPFIVPEKV